MRYVVRRTRVLRVYSSTEMEVEAETPEQAVEIAEEEDDGWVDDERVAESMGAYVRLCDPQ